MPHLLACITAHGYGHLAQTAPVLHALRARLPALRLTVWSSLPAALLRQRLPEPFELQPGAADPGMAMRSALAVDVEASAAAYRDLHRDWMVSVKREAARLAAQGPDLVLSNVGHLPLAAAAHAGTPALALCSLNWADIYAHYCRGRTGADVVEAQLRNAYRGAACFIQPTPSMPMADLPRRRRVGPIAASGSNRKAETCRRLGLDAGERWVLVNLGGTPGALSLRRWPRPPGIRWVAPAAWLDSQPAGLAQERIDLPFNDLLASCDALVTKPGYGIFVEAACAGVPVLYADRDGWPEQPELVAWLEAHGRSREIPQAALAGGGLAAELETLWARPVPSRPYPTGADEAAAILLEQL